MRKFMKKHRLSAPVILLLVSLLLMGYAAFSLSAVPGNLQYLWLVPPQQEPPSSADASGAPAPDQPAPDQPALQKINSGLRAARETLKGVAEQVEGACDPVTLYAIADTAAVSTEDGASAGARLEALEESAYGLKSMALTAGRYIYPEEFELGARVAMLDEQLAVALFQYAEPLERNVILAGETYRIVGIVRDHKQVGDGQEYGLYVPYRAMEKSSLPLTALCLEARPLPGTGGWAAFSSAVKGIEGGTAWHLGKETANALMPVRVLGVLCGVAVLFLCLRYMNIRFLAYVADYRARLTDAYAIRLMPRLLGQGGLLVLGYGVLTVLFAQLFVIAVAPVYTFPEWVPAVLVEPKDIAAAFWNVWQGMAQLTELRSPQALRIQFFARLTAWAAGGAALAAGVLWGRLRGAVEPLLKRDAE